MFEQQRRESGKEVVHSKASAHKCRHHKNIYNERHLKHQMGIAGKFSRVAWILFVRSTFETRVMLSCGVPQGSFLGPLLFSLYLLPLGSVLRASIGISFHRNAYDSQINVRPAEQKGHFLIKVTFVLFGGNQCLRGTEFFELQ